MAKQFYVILISLLFFGIAAADGGASAEQPTATQSRWENPLSLFGTRDLVAFWSGAQAAKNGLNPYDPTAVAPFQRAIDLKEPQYFLNPPWSLPVYTCFFSRLTFEQARYLWLTFNLFCLALAAKVTRLNCCRAPTPLLVVLGLTFLPAIYTLWMGQLDLFLLAAFLLSVHLANKGYMFRSGLLLGLTSLKPHLFLAIYGAEAIRALERRDGRAIAGATLTLASLCALSFALYSNIYAEWLSAPGYASTLRSSSIASYLREQLDPTGAVSWPIYFLALCSTVAGMLYARLSRGRPSSDDYAVLLTVSLCLAPYAWFYDYAMCLPVYFILAAKAFTEATRRTRVQRALFTILTPMLLVILTCGATTNLQHLSWFPWLMIALWFLLERAHSTRLTSVSGRTNNLQTPPTSSPHA